MEEKHSAVYDPEDARAYREQAELLKSQLDTAYRDIDKLKRDHDKEVKRHIKRISFAIDKYPQKRLERFEIIYDFMTQVLDF